MATMDDFAYSPLNQRGEIRLLKLLPQSQNSLFVRIELTPTGSKSPASFKYAALSYTWDDAFYIRPDPSAPKIDPILHDIECNGKLLKVRDNLFNALIRLRNAKPAEWYWIDAVCINQKDIPERSSQVSHTTIRMSSCSCC